MPDLSVRLSPHFTLREAVKSQTAARLGISNIPNAEAMQCIRLVAERILEPVRTHLDVPFSPSSWYRSPELNSAIGSKSTSQHIKGQAVDFEVPGMDNLSLARWCEANLDFDQLILEFHDVSAPYSGWVHCSYVGAENRHKVITIGKGYSLDGLPDG